MHVTKLSLNLLVTSK